MTKNPSFSFADLFAGIGGMRLAFERAGGECVLTSEIDLNAHSLLPRKEECKHAIAKNH